VPGKVARWVGNIALATAPLLWSARAEAQSMAPYTADQFSPPAAQAAIASRSLAVDISQAVRLGVVASGTDELAQRLRALLTVTQAMSATDRAALLRAADHALGSTEQMERVALIALAPELRALTPAERGRLLEAVERAAAAPMVEGQLHPLVAIGELLEAGPGRLQSRDRGGVSALDHFLRLTQAPLHPRLGHLPQMRGQLLWEVARGLSRPDRLNQGGYESCVPASIEHALSRLQPAEYARLTVELATSGRARTASGAALALPDTVAELGSGLVDLAEAQGGRTLTSALLQSAFFEYANGRASYDPLKDQSRRRVGLWSVRWTGLTVGQTRRLLGAVFGEPYQARRGPEFAAAFAAHARGEAPGLPGFLALERGGFSHLVVLREVREGRLYFRDANGASQLLGARREEGEERLFSIELGADPRLAVTLFEPAQAAAPVARGR
jgi:hypothetical protein